MENKRKLGTEKETLAAEYLKEHGVEILDRNFYFHGGELDLIARDGEYICFIEVKYRRNHAFGYPEEAVTAAKQRKICFGATVYLHQKQYPADTPCRFDVISVCPEGIRWIPDAFTAF